MKSLTEHQSGIVRQVWQCLQTSRFLTVSDLVQRMGLAGESSLMPTLQSIERKGYLVIHRWGKGQNRFIELTDKGIAQAQGLTAWPGLPVLGVIPAGPLAEATEDIIDYINPGNALRWRADDFFLQVDKRNGDSMRGVGILPGSYVLLRPNVEVYSGNIAAALVWTPERDCCEGTLKRVRFKTGNASVILEPENPEYRAESYPARRVSFAGVYQGCFSRAE
jgi:SOS-response transcriptional repressor LexA